MLKKTLEYLNEVNHRNKRKNLKKTNRQPKIIFTDIHYYSYYIQY